MKTLTGLLFVAWLHLCGGAFEALPTNPMRGIEAVEPIRERATASDLVHFNYRLDPCGGLRYPNSWSFGSWAGCSDIIVSVVSYYGFIAEEPTKALMGSSANYVPHFEYHIPDCPCIYPSLPNAQQQYQTEWLQWLAHKPRMAAPSLRQNETR